MFGLETEYAVVPLDGGGNPVRKDEVLGQLMNLAARRLVHLPGRFSSGVFLGNGSRLYVDCGNHPELATPECTDPWEAVRYVLAGDRILAGLIHGLVSRSRRLAKAHLFKANVDYSGQGTTWGSHESYLHRADPAALPADLVPHLASRLVYTGAGGFDNRSPGIEFRASPRVGHLQQVVSAASTHSRGIFHTKNETLSGPGYNRLHILCGESLSSETAAWLRTGTTALVVALAEAGLRPGAAVELAAPLEAMRDFAADPELKAAAALKRGGTISALGIQRHYLAMAEARLGEAFFPPWAEDVCRRWRGILDDLESSDPDLARKLDWAIKLALYRNKAEKRGLRWESFRAWNQALRDMQEKLGDEGKQAGPRLDRLLEAHAAADGGRLRLAPVLAAHGLAWESLPAFLKLRRELFEADLRFAEVGGSGVFAALDRAGVLQHEVPGVGDAERAAVEPPKRGRARLRGECIRRLAGRDGASCDWAGVWDSEGRFLDLSEPFQEKEEWQPCPAAKEMPPRPLGGPDESSFLEVLARLRELVVARRNPDR
jgi:proteasome accessory factor A